VDLSKMRFCKGIQRRLEFCPNDGTAMQLRARPLPEFELGLRRLLERLVPGTELQTIGGRETFRILSVTPGEIVIAPLSTLKERPIPVHEIEAIYRRWIAEGRDYTSSDYQSFTVNSVYILRFIREFWDVS
jgi:hypothetical protein